MPALARPPARPTQAPAALASFCSASHRLTAWTAAALGPFGPAASGLVDAQAPGAPWATPGPAPCHSLIVATHLVLGTFL